MRNGLILLGIVSACGKGGGDKAASIDLFGKKPVPPGELAKITPDMTQAQFKAAFPKAYPTPNHSGSPSLSIDSGYSNVKYSVGFYSDIDKVADIAVEVPKDLGAKLESAWGKPTGKSGFGPTWRNDDDGYVGELMEMGRRTEVRYKPFTPLTAAYFGSQPGPIEALTKLKLGMTRDEAAAAAPGFSLPPKESGSYLPNKGKADGVELEVRFAYDTDKVEAMQIRVPLKGVDLMTKAWGAPKPGKIRGDASPCVMWQTADKALQIELNPAGRETVATDCTSIKVVDVTIAAPEHSFCEVQP
jgi:hypothetical protein